MIAPLVGERTALLVVDVQDRLVAAMPAEVAATVVRNTTILIEAARRFTMPIVVSQQYPRGLGPTVPAIESALAGVAHVHRFDKLEFAATACAELTALVPELGTWIVCGMETHVCVYQTARGLVALGCTVHVAADATASRTKASWRTGLALADKAGAIVSSTEACVFDLLGRAGGDDFKALSKLVR